ncbi:MAG: alpha-L-glutamate ligase-like protein [Candidatus Zixiibacteriota bacterium]|nr:MAG: alpha-L-glutamate ligase-like protein [candidate division Zixibacteria bacterium]
MMRFGLKHLKPSARGLLGINGRNLELVYTHNPRGNFPNIDNKLRCKAMLASHEIPTPLTYRVITGPRTLRGWEDDVSEVSAFVIKPARGFGGGGIMVLNRCESGWSVSSGEMLSSSDIEFHVKQILNGAFSIDNISDIAFFEEKLENHPAIEALINPEAGGVADIRIIYQFNRPVMAMLRLPTKESDGKANLHQGGLGVGIDIDSGMTTGGCQRNDVITHHPETGIALSGHQMPDWRKLLDFGARIAEVVQLGYIGVDFVIDPRRGPLVLEVNARPGLNIQIANQCGLRGRVQWSYE